MYHVGGIFHSIHNLAMCRTEIFMNRTKEKKRTTTVRSELRRLVILSVAVVALIVGVISVLLVVNEIKQNYKNMAQASTTHLKEGLENGQHDWKYIEDTGTIFCGAKEISVDLFNEINNDDSSVFHTIFYDDTRVLTNIRDASGNYVLGTQADPKIYELVKAGNTYTKNSVKIINAKYTVCYEPIYTADDRFFGMLFTGINQDAVNRATLIISLSIIACAVVIYVAINIISNRLLLKISSALSSRMTDGYEELEAFSSKVKIISDKTDSEASEISKAMTNVAEGAMSQAAATEEAMASTEEFTSSISIVNNEIDESFNYIRTINACVEESENSISELNLDINNNNTIVQNVSHDIRMGVESTDQATKVVKAIDDLALQINLLALNASVEASHAGQYGKGFAVVAEEIKTLANNSAESARETSEIIKGIVNTMKKATLSNEQLVAANNLQLEKAAVVSEKMAALKTNIFSIERKLENIREKADSLNIVKDELLEVISRLSSGSEQNAAISEQVSASTTSVSCDINDLSSSLKTIGDICESLKNLIEYFG